MESTTQRLLVKRERFHRTLGKAVSTARKESNFSRADLANRSNLRPRIIGDIEEAEGAEWVSIAIILRLAVAMNKEAQIVFVSPEAEGDRGA